MPEQLIIAFWLWVAGLVLALARAARLARVLIAIGAADGIWGAVIALPHGGSHHHAPDLTRRPSGSPAVTRRRRYGYWVSVFCRAGLAVALSTPIRRARPAWLAGAALSLIGAFGVFGLQDAYSFLIAWELMSVGGAALILSERTSAQAGQCTLYMLALLEAGVVGILLALLLLAQSSGGSVGFDGYTVGGHALSSGGTHRGRPARALRLRRQAGSPALLRMVSRRLRQRQWGFGRDHVRSSPQRRLLWPVAYPAATGWRRAAECSDSVSW